MTRWSMTGLAAALALGLTACRPADSGALDVKLLTPPDALQVGPAQLDLQLPTGLADARVSVEGNMTHAGMRPVQANAQPVGPGHYRVPGFPFTMAGDWVLTVTARPPQGPSQSADLPVEVSAR